MDFVKRRVLIEAADIRNWIELEDLHLHFPPQHLTLFEAETLQRPSAQFLQMASQSIALFNDGQQSVLNAAASPVIFAISIVRVVADPHLQLVCGRAFSVKAPEEFKRRC